MKAQDHPLYIHKHSRKQIPLLGLFAFLAIPFLAPHPVQAAELDSQIQTLTETITNSKIDLSILERAWDPTDPRAETNPTNGRIKLIKFLYEQGASLKADAVKTIGAYQQAKEKVKNTLKALGKEKTPQGKIKIRKLAKQQLTEAEAALKKAQTAVKLAQTPYDRAKSETETVFLKLDPKILKKAWSGKQETICHSHSAFVTQFMEKATENYQKANRVRSEQNNEIQLLKLELETQTPSLLDDWSRYHTAGPQSQNAESNCRQAFFSALTVNQTATEVLKLSSIAQGNKHSSYYQSSYQTDNPTGTKPVIEPTAQMPTDQAVGNARQGK